MMPSLILRRRQLAQQILSEEQQQRATQDYRAEIIRVEAERQRQVEKRQLEQQRCKGTLGEAPVSLQCSRARVLS